MVQLFCISFSRKRSRCCRPWFFRNMHMKQLLLILDNSEPEGFPLNPVYPLSPVSVCSTGLWFPMSFYPTSSDNCCGLHQCPFTRWPSKPSGRIDNSTILNIKGCSDRSGLRHVFNSQPFNLINARERNVIHNVTLNRKIRTFCKGS